MPVVFVLIWSTGFIVAKFGLPYAPPLTFLAIRYLLSIVCFLAWTALAKAAWPQGRAQWLHLGVTGVLMHAGYLGGVWIAVKGGMGSGLAALIVGLQPVLTALWVSWIASVDTGQNEQKVTPRQWLGLALGLGGLAGWIVVTMIFDFTWQPSWLVVLATVLLGAAVTIGLGLLGSWRALSVRPNQVLRTL